MTTTYEQMAQKITQDPSTSSWLKDAVHALSQRDPCDAVSDIETLQALCLLRLAALASE